MMLRKRSYRQLGAKFALHSPGLPRGVNYGCFIICKGTRQDILNNNSLRAGSPGMGAWVIHKSLAKKHSAGNILLPGSKSLMSIRETHTDVLVLHPSASISMPSFVGGGEQKAKRPTVF